MVHLVRALGLALTAEGWRAWSSTIGCHEIQGFLLTESVPAQNITRLLAAGARREGRLVVV